MDYRNIPLGAIPSPPDKRDYPLAKIMRPVKLDKPRGWQLPIIKDQGDIGKCVGEGISYNREAVEAVQTGSYRQYSDDFAYQNRKPTDSQGQGRITREALMNTLEDGCCYLEDYNNPKEYPECLSDFNIVKSTLLPKAKPHRITAFAAVNTDDEIVQALSLSPVITVYPIYESFFKTGEDGIVPIPNTIAERFYGYHCMDIFDMRDDYTWTVPNSWGKGFGDKGVLHIPIKVNQQEIWAVTDNELPFKEEEKLDKLIIYYDEPDKKYAETLNDFIGTYMISEADYKRHPIKADLYYKVGGTWIPEGNVIQLAGAGRKDTAINVLKYVSTL